MKGEGGGGAVGIGEELMVSLNAWEPVTLRQRSRVHLACSHFDLERSTVSSQDRTREQEKQLLLLHLTRSGSACRGARRRR